MQGKQRNGKQEKGKERNEKQWNGKRAVFLREGRRALLALAIVGLTGCVPQTEAPVVGTREAGGGEMKNTEMPLEENIQGESGLETETGKEEFSPSGSFAGSGSPEQVLASAPERYQARIQEDGVDIMADAEILVPPIEKVPVFEVEHAPYEAEDGENARKILAEELGVDGWNIRDEAGLARGGTAVLEPGTYIQDESQFMRLDEIDGVQSYDSSDGSYNFDFGRGIRSDRTPMMWLEYTKGGGYYGGLADVESVWGKEETAKREQELEEKAEALLGKLSAFSFEKKELQWRRLSAPGSGLKWEPEEQYFCRIRFERVYEGIPCISGESCWAAEELQSPQYADICYSEGGTLLQLKIINRERVSANVGEVEVLYPFEVAAQIFEQYMRYYQTVYQVPEQYLVNGQGERIAKAGENPHLYLDVTRVRFAYELRYDDWNGDTLDRGSGKGRLVPVWAFYGTPKVGKPAEDGKGIPEEELTPIAAEDSLLLTINAENGMVYGKN